MSNCAAPRHGTFYAYRVHRCRCPEMMRRRAEYAKAYREGRRPSVLDRSPHIDEIAVELALAGAKPKLTLAERGHVVKILTNRGKSAAQIADLVGVCKRQVVRYRSGKILYAQVAA